MIGPKKVPQIMENPDLKNLKEKNQDLENQLKQYQEQNKQLIGENYLQSLSDEKVFRLEMLQALVGINQTLEKLNQTVVEISSRNLEEQTEEQENNEQNSPEL